MLDGMLGSSRRGDLETLTKHLVTVTMKLPGELKSGGKNALMATLQTLVDIFLNLGKVVRSKNGGDMTQVFQHLQAILQILQGRHITCGFKPIITFSHEILWNSRKH